MSCGVCGRFLIFNINNAVLCHTIAIWLTIALAIFRYICVCYPTRGAQLCSLQRAKVAIFAIYVTSAVVCIPNYMVTSSLSLSIFNNVNKGCKSQLYLFESQHGLLNTSLSVSCEVALNK